MNASDYGLNDYESFHPQSGYPRECHRMEVSDDDGSIVDTIETALGGWYGGSASPSATASGVFSSKANNIEPYQITPQLLHPDEFLTTRTETPSTRATANAGNKSDDTKNLQNVNSLPLLPPFDSHSVSDQTALTIRKRRSRALNSPIRLVDGYEVNDKNHRAAETQTGLNFEESRDRHDFNACRQTDLKPTEDTSTGNLNMKKGIKKNQVLEIRGPHKIAHHLDRNPNCNKTSICNSESRTRRQEFHKTESDSDNAIVTKKNIIKNKRPSVTTMMSSQVADCRPHQRSRAIAIRRTRPIDVIDGYRSENRNNARERECDTELYDYATWRMYNRIIDHRRKNLLRNFQQQQDQDHHSASSSSIGTYRSTSPDSNGGSASHIKNVTNDHHGARAVLNYQAPVLVGGQQYFVHQQVTFTRDDYLSDGENDEIFDLEL